MEENANDVMVAIDLRDIHLPLDVPWWPLANGWWLLLLMLLFAMGLIVHWRHSYLQQHSLRNVATRELKQLQGQSLPAYIYFKELYSILRRITRQLPETERFNRDDGCQWFLWLLQRSQLETCSKTLQTQLESIPYRPETDEILEVVELEQLTIAIIESLPEIRLHTSMNACTEGNRRAG